MTRNVTLRITGRQHASLEKHLFPGDGKEAVAILLCGRRVGKHRHILTVRKIFPIPHESCATRTPYRVTWPTETLIPILEEAMKRDLAVVKVHGHPEGVRCFSEVDDVSDRELFPSIFGWVNDDYPHGSAVMLPGGKMFGRAIFPDDSMTPFHSISVAGPDLRFWCSQSQSLAPTTQRHAQAFGEGTAQLLRNLSVAVVGYSGTGSPTVEQLARLQVGRLVVVDPKAVGEKNLNRILNTRRRDVVDELPKVKVAERAVTEMDLGTAIEVYAENLYSPKVVKAVAECDVVFGCVDSVDGRHLLNRLCTFYNIPYFDIGVKLVADGDGGVDQICGTVHYLQPDGSSLMSRRVYTLEQVRAASLRRTDPLAYEEQQQAKYIDGVNEERPAVISVNMFYAALAVNEFLARVHGYRDDSNEDFAVYRFSLTQSQIYRQSDGEPCPQLAPHVGRGDVRPLLDMPVLSEARIRS